MISTSLEVWIGAFLTLSIFSFAYKENIFYRFAEHTMIGLYIAYFWVGSIKGIINMGLNPLLKGEVFYVIPLALGFILLLTFSKQYRSLSRWPLALMVTVSVVVTGRATFETNFIKQIIQSANSLNPGTLMGSVNNTLMFIITLSVLFYFYFSKEMKGSLKKVNLLGRYFLLVAFGASFGGTVMARLGMFIARMNFLVNTWLGF